MVDLLGQISATRRSVSRCIRIIVSRNRLHPLVFDSSQPGDDVNQFVQFYRMAGMVEKPTKTPKSADPDFRFVAPASEPAVLVP